MSGSTVLIARMQETIRSTSASTSPSGTPVVSDTATVPRSSWASLAFAAISASVWCLKSDSGSLGEAQNAHLKPHLLSRVKNDCPGQWWATGSNSTLSRKGSPPWVRL